MESYSCWASAVIKYKMDKSRVETTMKKVKECMTATDFVLSGRMGVGNLRFMSPGTSKRLLPAPALKPQNPFASHGLDQLCPSMWTDSARHVHHLLRCARSLHALITKAHEKPQRSWDWLSWLISFTNSLYALPIIRGNFRYKDVALTVESNQWSWSPPLPHPVYIYRHPFLTLNILPE